MCVCAFHISTASNLLVVAVATNARKVSTCWFYHTRYSHFLQVVVVVVIGENRSFSYLLTQPFSLYHSRSIFEGDYATQSELFLQLRKRIASVEYLSLSLTLPLLLLCLSLCVSHMFYRTSTLCACEGDKCPLSSGRHVSPGIAPNGYDEL